MNHLTIRIKKKADGTAALSCVRADGSTTWQRQEGTSGRFFPLHDLTHYAVESTLGHHRGFFGLVAGGWDLTDFGRPWPKGPLPPDLDPSELIVGFLDLERATGHRWTAADLNEKLTIALGANAKRSLVTDAQLAAVRATMAELFDRWQAVAPGDALELQFPASEAPLGQR
jgi:hypothetical protein